MSVVGLKQVNFVSKKQNVEIFKIHFHILKKIPIIAIRFLRAKNRFKS
jgi:hypothetical protein